MQAVQDFFQPALDQGANLWHWSKGALYSTLQWTTSWLYYGLGASMGLAAGSVDAVVRYWSHLTFDAMEWAGIQPPYLIQEGQKAHFGPETLKRVEKTVKEKVPSAAPLVEGISPAGPGAGALPAQATPTKKGTDIASNVSQAVKEKAADAKEAVKRVPAAVPGLGGAAHTSAASAKTKGAAAHSTASTQVLLPGVNKPIDISFTRD